MDRKTAFYFILIPLLMSCLSVLLCLVDIGQKALFTVLVVTPSIITLLLSNVHFSVSFKYELKLLLIFAFGIFFAFTLCKGYEIFFGLPTNRITAIEGKMLYDSSFSGSGKSLVRISLERCRDNCGNWTSAKGIVTALGDKRAVVTSGIEVRLEGAFSDELFIYDKLLVTERSSINDIREYLIETIEERLYGDSFKEQGEPDEPALLSSLLLLGRAEDYNFPLAEAARNCGCAHVLALSGMHLSVLASLCSTLFGKRKWARVLTGIVIGIFVFIAGPRPSLVRSAIMFFLGKRFSSKQKIVMAFFIQSLLLPFSMLDLGCCYGYVSVFAIIYLWAVIKAPFEAVCGKKFLNSFFLSVSVLLLCAPVQLLNDGFWCPVALIVSSLASFLVTLSMGIGLLILSFGRLNCLIWLNSLVYNLLSKIFEFFGNVPKAGWFSYGIMVLAVVVLEVVCLLYRKRQKGKIKTYCFAGKFDLEVFEKPL